MTLQLRLSTPMAIQRDSQHGGKQQHGQQRDEKQNQSRQSDASVGGIRRLGGCSGKKSVRKHEIEYIGISNASFLLPCLPLKQQRSSQLEMENKASCGQIRMEPPMRERVD